MTDYYVDTAVGNDANAGTSEGSGNAWATMQHALDSIAQGDHIYVKATGTYSEALQVNVIGGASNPITVEGYSTTPGDNGRVTIDGTTSAISPGTVISSAYYVWKNFAMNNHSGSAVNATNMDQMSFYNCQFNNNGGRGVLLDNNINAVDCEFIGNAGTGYDVDATGTAIGCEIGNNSAYGTVMFGGGCLLYRCAIYGWSDTLYGTYMNGSTQKCIGNTFVGTSAGVGSFGIFHTDVAPVIVDNIVADCETAIRLDTNVGEDCVIGYNLIDSCTNHYSYTTGNNHHVGYQSISSGSANFTNKAGDDYTLQETSDAIDAGVTPGLAT